MAKENAIRDDNNVSGIMGKNEALGYIENVRLEDGYLIVLTRVWNSSTSNWDRMTQPLANVDNLENITAGLYYEETRVSYDVNNDPEYVGYNTELNASVSGIDWQVTKYTRTSGNVTRIQVNEGAWSNRTSLF